MRLLLCLAISVTVTAGKAAEDKPTKAITPREAAKQVGKTCTVEFYIDGSDVAKGGKVAFLSSEGEFVDAKDRFTAMLGEKALKAYKEQKINNVAAHFYGKTIRVTGTVKAQLSRGMPGIIVNDPKQIVIVKKK
jgi:hypothetical protein